MPIQIELALQEHEYLIQALFVPNSIKKMLLLGRNESNSYLIEISEDQADELRDLCSEQLDTTGFDDQYKLTKEGEILEALIDKLFVG